MKRCLTVPVLAALLALQAPATADKSAGGRLWFRSGKVRCIAYLDASEFMAKSVPKAKAMGFNSALVSWGGAPVSNLMPLIEAADRADLRLVMVTSLRIGEYLKNSPGERRFIGPDGVTQPASPCPTSERFWQTTIGKPALVLARLRGDGHRSLAGMLFDKEDYDNPIPSLYCYCDHCFGAFLKAIGKEGLSVAAAERHSWVVNNNLWDRYREFQDRAAVTIFAAIRKQINELAADFVIATYPWNYIEPAVRQSRADWDIRFARGLGTAASPFMALDEGTYTWGHGPALERQRAEYAAQGLHFLAITGFNVVPAERVWYPEQMAESAYWACRRGDGYWIFLGAEPLLRAAAGERPGWLANYGGRPREWVEQFTAVNTVIVSGKTMRTPPLTLPPMKQHWELSDVFGTKCSPGADSFVRRWTDIGLPWEGGELVLLAEKPGDWLSFNRPVRGADRYLVSLWLTTGPDRGIARLYADSKPVGEPVDLYAPITTPGDALAVGFIDLERGEHTWRLQVMGKNERASGYDIGFRGIWMEDVGYPPIVWSVIGPFDNTGEDLPGYDAIYPPEKEINLEATYAGKRGEPVRWHQAKAQPNGYLNLLSAFSEFKDAVAYCLTFVYSPSDGPRQVMLGSDDGGKLFVNGEMVWGEPVARAAEPDQNEPRAYFRRGWNTILFKVLQTGGEWGIYLRVDDPKHELKYSPVPPQEHEEHSFLFKGVTVSTGNAGTASCVLAKANNAFQESGAR